MARKQIYYTAGPAELYPKFEQYMLEALELQLGSISHRSAQFKKIYQHTDEQLRALMAIPADNAIMFTGTASEIWERIILNMVEQESFHLVNGSFSKKFYTYAKALNRTVSKLDKEMGEGFKAADISVPDTAELIAATQNETSSGVQMPEAEIHALKAKYPSNLLAVDMVSSAPIPALDYSLVDTAFFSVQKSFGMPAGLGVWIANAQCLAKAEELLSKGKSIGAHHALPELWQQSKEYQTPATPNVLAIFLLGRIAEDMNKTGIDNIRKTTDQKAQQIYDFFAAKTGYSLGVNDAYLRSRTVAVINTDEPSAKIIEALKHKNLIVGAGYGPKKASQIRVSNFIANTPEQIDLLLKEIDQI